MREWRPLLRLARRGLTRRKARTLLVGLMIGLPVAVGVAVDLAVQTHEGAPEAEARRVLGGADLRVYDAWLTRLPAQPVTSTLREGSWSSGADDASQPPDRDRPLRTDRVKAALPAGSTVHAPCDEAVGGVTVAHADALARVDVVSCAFDPVSSAQLRLRDGRLPTSPGEVAVSGGAARVLGLASFTGLDDAATITYDGHTYDVVGLTIGRWSDDRMLFAEPASPVVAEARARAARTGDGEDGSPASWLVTLPPPWADDPDLMQRLADRFAAMGATTDFAAAAADPETFPPLAGYGAPSVDALIYGAVCIGFGVLEIVLLAGSALAVAIRGQAREIGLLGAVGADRRGIRRLVLAQTLGLSVPSAVVAVPVGVLAVLAIRPFVEYQQDADWSTLVVSPTHYAALAAIGVLAGLSAAIVPARAATRMEVVDALDGRLARSRVGVRVPRRRLVAAAFAAAIAVAGGAAVTHYLPLVEAGTGPEASIIASAAVLLAGVLALTILLATLLSPLLGLVGRGALGRLKLPARFAVRDVGRQRTRMAPAAAAVMVAVAASLGITLVLAGADASNRHSYRPMVPEGMFAVEGYSGEYAADLQQVDAMLPGLTTLTSRSVYEWASTGRSHPYLEISEPTDSIWDLSVPGPGLIRAFYPDQADEVLAALDRGEAVIVGRGPSLDHVTLKKVTGKGRTKARITVPITYVDGPVYERTGGVLVSEHTAHTLGLRLDADSTMHFLVPTQPLDQDVVDTAVETLRAQDIYLDQERGYQAVLPFAVMAAAGVTTLVALVAPLIAAGLAQVEARPDITTLAAVGASRGARRRVVFWQTLVVCATGAWVGGLLGSFGAFVLRGVTGSFSLHLLPMVGLLLVLPFVTAGLAALGSRPVVTDLRPRTA